MGFCVCVAVGFYNIKKWWHKNVVFVVECAICMCVWQRSWRLKCVTEHNPFATGSGVAIQYAMHPALASTAVFFCQELALVLHMSAGTSLSVPPPLTLLSSAQTHAHTAIICTPHIIPHTHHT